MATVLSHKFETDIEIKASAEKFHDTYLNRPQHVSNASGDKVHACELDKGSFGVVGSITIWSYFHDGKARKRKTRVAAVDSDKNSITWRMIEGDLMRQYKNFPLTCQVTNESDGTGAIVHWSLEYEKLHDGVDHPETMLQLLADY